MQVARRFAEMIRRQASLARTGIPQISVAQDARRSDIDTVDAETGAMSQKRTLDIGCQCDSPKTGTKLTSGRCCQRSVVFRATLDEEMTVTRGGIGTISDTLSGCASGAAGSTECRIS